MIDEILKEIEENPIQQIETSETADNKLPVVISVDLRTRKEIIRDWLSGMEKKEIAAKYSLPTRSISVIIDKNDDLRLDIEKRHLAITAARENVRLSETKNKMLNYIDSTLDETFANNSEELTPEKKLKFLGGMAMLWDKIAATARLNQEKPTQIMEKRELKADLSEILKQLPTAEDKMNFLRQQSQGMKSTDVVDGQIIN